MEVNEKNLIAFGFIEVDKEGVYKSKSMEGKLFALISRGHIFNVTITPNGENEFYISTEVGVKYNIYHMYEMLGIIADCFIKHGKNEKIQEIKAFLEIK